MTCTHKDCNARAEWQPVMQFYALPNTVPAEGSVSMGFCEAHKHVLTLDDLLTDEGWRMICSRWPASKMQPNRVLTRLTFRRIRA